MALCTLQYVKTLHCEEHSDVDMRIVAIQNGQIDRVRF